MNLAAPIKEAAEKWGRAIQLELDVMKKNGICKLKIKRDEMGSSGMLSVEREFVFQPKALKPAAGDKRANLHIAFPPTNRPLRALATRQNITMYLHGRLVRSWRNNRCFECFRPRGF